MYRVHCSTNEIKIWIFYFSSISDKKGTKIYLIYWKFNVALNSVHTAPVYIYVYMYYDYVSTTV